MSIPSFGLFGGIHDRKKYIKKSIHNTELNLIKINKDKYYYGNMIYVFLNKNNSYVLFSCESADGKSIVFLCLSCTWKSNINIKKLKIKIDLIEDFNGKCVIALKL